MLYQLEDIQFSQQIFYRLIEKHQIQETTDYDLYQAYIGNECVRLLVKEQAETAMCQIECYGDTLYLIPKEGNEVLGFSKRELKQKLCSSKGTDKDYYLSQFVILMILVNFYEGQGASSHSREFMQVGELQNLILEQLKVGVNHFSNQEQKTSGIAFTNMLEAYESLRSDENSRAKSTKEGFISGILRFLQDQGLIEYLEADDLIKTTDKLNRLMDFNLLNQNHYDRVVKVLGGTLDESN